MAKRLTAAAIKTIGGNSELYKEICQRLNVKPTSLPVVLQRNGDNLNQYDVVELVAKYMKIKPSEAVEEIDTVSA